MSNLSASTREIANKQRGMLNNFSLLLISPSGKENAVAGKSGRTFNVMRQLNLCRFLQLHCTFRRVYANTCVSPFAPVHGLPGFSTTSVKKYYLHSWSNNFQMTFKQIPPPAAHHQFFNELFSSSVCRASPSSLLIADGNGDFH